MGEGEQRWCSVCGAEHESWASRCAVCDGALATHPPAPVEVDHSVSEVDIAPLGVDERATLQLLLRVEEVPHEFDGSVMRVPANWSDTARQMVADVLEPLDPAVQPPGLLDHEALTATASQQDAPAERELASLGWRVLARIADLILFILVGLVISVLLGLLSQLEPQLTDMLLRVSELPWPLLLEIVLVARFGWDLGKLAVGLRVVDADGRPPGWRRALVRSAVLWGPPIAILIAARVLTVEDVRLAGAVAVLTYGWFAAISWSIARDEQRRGWHDRAAGTWVLR